MSFNQSHQSESLVLHTNDNTLSLYGRLGDLTDCDISLQLVLHGDIGNTLYLLLYAPLTGGGPTSKSYMQLHNALNKSIRQKQMEHVKIEPADTNGVLSTMMRDTHIKVQLISPHTILLDLKGYLYGYGDLSFHRDNPIQLRCHITSDTLIPTTDPDNAYIVDHNLLMPNLLQLFARTHKK